MDSHYSLLDQDILFHSQVANRCHNIDIDKHYIPFHICMGRYQCHVFLESKGGKLVNRLSNSASIVITLVIEVDSSGKMLL